MLNINQYKHETKQSGSTPHQRPTREARTCLFDLVHGGQHLLPDVRVLHGDLLAPLQEVGRRLLHGGDQHVRALTAALLLVGGALGVDQCGDLGRFAHVK